MKLDKILTRMVDRWMLTNYKVNEPIPIHGGSVALPEAKQAIREAIEQCHQTVIEKSESTDATFKRGINLGAELMKNHLLAKLGLEDDVS